MSKRDNALFKAHDALLFAFQKVNEAQLVCKAEGYIDDASELDSALEHTQQALDWVKITRGKKVTPVVEAETVLSEFRAYLKHNPSSSFGSKEILERIEGLEHGKSWS